MFTRLKKWIIAGGTVIGLLLAWTGWTGPELLNKIAEFPYLAFIGSDAFRTFLVLAGVGLILLSGKWWHDRDFERRRQERIAAKPPQPPTIDLEPRTEGIDLEMNKHRLRIGVLNNGSVGQFYARVWAFRGIAATASPPWEIKWRQDDPDPYCWIKHGNMEILELGTLVDPEPQNGLLFHFHGPREDWHGVLTDPEDLNSGFIQIRVWHVEMDDFVEAWFQVVIGEHRFPELVTVSADAIA